MAKPPAYKVILLFFNDGNIHKRVYSFINSLFSHELNYVCMYLICVMILFGSMGYCGTLAR